MSISIKKMNDVDKEVAAETCKSIAEIITESAKSDGEYIEPYKSRLGDAIVLLVCEISACSQDELRTEYGNMIVNAVFAELLPAFASVSPDFALIFQKLVEPMMKYAVSTELAEDVATVVGFLGNVAKSIDPDAFFLRELASPETNNRRNAAFCAGELCKWESMSKHYLGVLHLLIQILEDPKADSVVRDNAAGAIAKMITAGPSSLLLDQLDQVLPVFLKALPLKEDRAESMAVYKCINDLVNLSSSHTQIRRFLPQFSMVLKQVRLNDETEAVGALIQQILVNI
ncbi:hypothetical protein C5167_001230 [Papaver somniferum]|uniref:TOG domain-containing protein n=1 Tax=Papaver somniferum TaxID=3469 RepID=A0A4Y7KXG5_PAPSO|nr:hypothetical protein C5167_001230 [Papaver somniferum]